MFSQVVPSMVSTEAPDFSQVIESFYLDFRSLLHSNVDLLMILFESLVAV